MINEVPRYGVIFDNYTQLLFISGFLKLHTFCSKLNLVNLRGFNRETDKQTYNASSSYRVP